MLILFILKGFIKISRGAGDRQTELMKALIGRLTDMLQGIKPIKAMAKEDHIQALLESETEDIKKAQQRHVLASESLKAFQEPFLVIMIAVGHLLRIDFWETVLFYHSGHGISLQQAVEPGLFCPEPVFRNFP